MGDEGDFWRDVKDARREHRVKFGIPCPHCEEAFPRGNATILMPQQRCRVCGYRDPRIGEPK